MRVLEKLFQGTNRTLVRFRFISFQTFNFHSVNFAQCIAANRNILNSELNKLTLNS